MPAFLAWPVLKAFFGGVLGSIWKAIAAFFGSLNSQGWLGFIGCAAMGLLWLHTAGEARHWHKQSVQYQKLHNNDLAHDAKIAKQAVDLKAKVDALTLNISRTLREWNDAQNSRIAGAADDLRLRGPGKAVCPGNPVDPSGSGKSQQPGRSGNAAVAPVSDAGGQLAALPFSDTVTFGQSHDAYRAEVMTWRQWYQRLVAAWPKQ